MGQGVLSSIGIEVALLLAGLAGGVVYSFMIVRSRPLDSVGSVLSSGLMSNYVADYFAKYIGTPAVFTAFIVGLAATLIAEFLFAKVRNLIASKQVGGS